MFYQSLNHSTQFINTITRLCLTKWERCQKTGISNIYFPNFSVFDQAVSICSAICPTPSNILLLKWVKLGLREEHWKKLNVNFPNQPIRANPLYMTNLTPEIQNLLGLARQNEEKHAKFEMLKKVFLQNSMGLQPIGTILLSTVNYNLLKVRVCPHWIWRVLMTLCWEVCTRIQTAAAMASTIWKQRFPIHCIHVGPSKFGWEYVYKCEADFTKHMYDPNLMLY